MALALAVCFAQAMPPIACAEDAGGGTAGGGSGQQSDPTATPALDPHGAIRAMSEASEPGGKPDHAVTTTVPKVATPDSASGR